MKKGFALDDDRLKRLGGGNYFEESLARIRDIRSSEKAENGCWIRNIIFNFLGFVQTS